MLHHGNCNISLQQTSARDTYNFSSCENGAFLIVEATVCCPFYYWSEIKVVRTKIVMQSAYTSAIERSIEMEWAWLRRFNALRCNWVMLLSCDCVLKFDWYCQLSGSGSNSLNSQKLPGHFSYGLGTRLEYCVAHTNHISPSLQLIPQLLCCTLPSYKKAVILPWVFITQNCCYNVKHQLKLQATCVQNI